MALPSDQLPVGEGVRPDGAPAVMFYLDRGTLDAAREHGPPARYEDARFIPEAVGRPDAIFEVSPEEGGADCYGYSVRPEFDPDEPDAPLPPRFGLAFVVFARPCVGGMLVYDWEWREESPDDPGHPRDWAKEFTRRTWQRT